MTVYEIQGWFGDIEWSEGLYAIKEAADAECARLWKTRCSVHAPDFVQGYCKFAVEPREVIGSAA